MPFVGIAIYALAVYPLYTYYKNAPIVAATDTAIRIGGKTYAWVDIDDIELTSKRVFPYLVSYAMETVAIHFRNGQTKYLYDDMYENLWEL